MLQHVTAHHLTRLACLYVRQSTLQQVLENTESTSRQYALRERARAVGWADERIVVSTLDRVAADAQEHQLGTPSIIVIGNIVKVRERLIDAVRMAESEAAR